MYWRASFVSVGRRRLYPSIEELRCAVKTLVRVLQQHLLLFSIVDDHIHLLIKADKKTRAVLLSAAHRALAAIGHETKLCPAWYEEVETRRHLLTLVEYYGRQPSHHDLAQRDVLWEGSSVMDLIGARKLEFYDGTLWRAAVPRWREGDLLRKFGIYKLKQASDKDIAAMGPEKLLYAATVAFCAQPGLRGKQPSAVLARAIVVHLGRHIGYSTNCLAPLLVFLRGLSCDWQPGMSKTSILGWFATSWA
jgi:hypothetical protein